MMRNRTVLVAAGALVAATLTFTACSATAPNEGAGTSANSQFNDADIEFAQMMIPHHEGAIGMAQIIRNRDGIDRSVTDLAQRIQAAQGPEIDQLGHWLDDWGADKGMPHDMGDMMSDEGMAELKEATGDEASRLFLEQMIVHHQGAIEMAQTEIEEGVNPDAKAMAQDIIDAQQSEIEEMRNLLTSL